MTGVVLPHCAFGLITQLTSAVQLGARLPTDIRSPFESLRVLVPERALADAHTDK